MRPATLPRQLLRLTRKHFKRRGGCISFFSECQILHDGVGLSLCLEGCQALERASTRDDGSCAPKPWSSTASCVRAKGKTWILGSAKARACLEAQAVHAGCDAVLGAPRHARPGVKIAKALSSFTFSRNPPGPQSLFAKICHLRSSWNLRKRASCFFEGLASS